MSETRDPILENMEAFYKECHAQVREMREKLKIATVANEQFKADLHHRDAENAQLREKLAAARRSLEYYADAEWLQSFGGTKMAEKALAIIDGKEDK